MRTTLDIDGDVLHAVKELGALQRKTAGKVLSELARKALRPEVTDEVRNGVPLLLPRPGAGVVTREARRAPSRRDSVIGLLDVNALVALFDPDHVHHRPAHEWLAAHRPEGWATCPLSENGLVR